MIRVKFDDKQLRMSGGVVDIACADTIHFFFACSFRWRFFPHKHTCIDEQNVVVRDLGMPSRSFKNKPAERRLLSSRCRASGGVHWQNFSSRQSSYRSTSLRPTNT